jgi:Zn-dependent metalloprotease
LRLLLALLLLTASTARATAADAVADLERAAGGPLWVSTHPATGTVRFVRPLRRGAALPLPPPVATLGVKVADADRYTEAARAFLDRYAAAFGADPADLVATAGGTGPDALGYRHLGFTQQHRDVPVFASRLTLHFAPDGALRAVNGLAVPLPDDLDETPTISARSARRTALAAVARAAPSPPPRGEGAPVLSFFHTGLTRGVPGQVHLAWQVVVRAGARRFRAFVDATDGKLVDLLPASSEALHREVFVDGTASGQRVWREGDSLPYQGAADPEENAAVNELVASTASVYDLFRRLSGGRFLSWDGRSATLRSVYRTPGLLCPNASWNGETTNFCAGTASDDFVAHEWTHAYTQSTHGLLYQWQTGALNEAYSDIFGEVVDLLDGRGSDAPGGRRQPQACSALGSPGSPTVTVSQPVAIAGVYSAGKALFGPSVETPVEGAVVVAEDAANDTGPATSDACTTILNPEALRGRIALVDRGVCTFVSKVKNAQAAGASGVIVVNNQGNGLVNMAGDDATITIPSLFLAQEDGDTLRRGLVPGPLVTTLGLTQLGEGSLSWLFGEDASAYGGAVRDLWNPSCFANANRVGDARYTCGPGTEGNDYGGVHWNSGIAARGFAMLVDGSDADGLTVAPIGLVKAASLYWRAMSVYQTPTSDFADHADALEAACADLVASGAELPRLDTDGASGEHFASGDCDQVSRTINYLQLRRKPAQCAFAPLLAANVPPACRVGTPTTFWSEGFEAGAGGWKRSNQGVFREYQPRDWELVDGLPGQRPGGAFFADDPPRRGNCQAGSDDQSGVARLESPAITLPTSSGGGASGELVLAFAHNLATEPGRDGGVLELSRNGGAWQVVPREAYLFNPPKVTLDPAPGNRNPLASSLAWSGTDDGSLGGSWGETRVDLRQLAAPGDSVRLRFSLGTDGCQGREGWYLDDLAAYRCVADAACTPDANTLCLLGGRYRAQVTWQNQYSGGRGVGIALPYADFTGFFAFDDPANVELVVKLLDFTAEGGPRRVKVFYGQLTNLRFDLTITDTASGASKTYSNTAGDCGAIDQEGLVADLAPANPGAPTGWRAIAELAPAPAAVGTCVATADTLCLLDRRFAVRVGWRNQYAGSNGAGQASALSDLAGLFTFTDPRNVEALVKLLDFGDRILLLYGSLSDLEYQLDVVDTVTGAHKTYTNPAGRYCGGIDDHAF